MSRYIDADALKEAMQTYGFHSADQTITEFVEDILPTADVVPSKYGCGSAPYCSDVWEVDEDE